MPAPRYLAEGECSRVVGLRDAAAFFGAVSQLLPDATHVFLEGAPAPAVVALISQHSAPVEYRAPAGTLWSWPRSNRFALAASPTLFSQLAEASTRHAEPEICDHLHFYR